MGQRAALGKGDAAVFAHLEFLWQEGHTAHATAEEAREETLRMLDLYREFAENVAAIPVYTGRKSASERFPGAVDTFSIEALMPDGKALQSGTSHDLGQNFAQAPTILRSPTPTARSNTLHDVVGHLVADDRRPHHGARRRSGLRIPPKLAPIEAVLIPIVRKNDDRAIARCHELAAELTAAGFRVKVDARDEQPGWKYSEWDIRGVPVRIEIGPRDIDAGTAVVARRDRGKDEAGQRESMPVTAIAGSLRALLDDIQASLYRQAKAFLDSHTMTGMDRETFFALCSSRAGMVEIPWCERPECEAEVKKATTATTRVVRPLDEANLRCTACGEPARVRAYFAQSY